jgi:hypothetical protein
METPMPEIRRYSIQITDVDTGKDVILTAADLTAEELRVVVAQIARLSGAPPDNCFTDLAAPKP